MKSSAIFTNDCLEKMNIVLFMSECVLTIKCCECLVFMISDYIIELFSASFNKYKSSLQHYGFMYCHYIKAKFVIVIFITLLSFEASP